MIIGHFELHPTSIVEAFTHLAQTNFRIPLGTRYSPHLTTCSSNGNPFVVEAIEEPLSTGWHARLIRALAPQRKNDSPKPWSQFYRCVKVPAAGVLQYPRLQAAVRAHLQAVPLPTANRTFGPVAPVLWTVTDLGEGGDRVPAGLACHAASCPPRSAGISLPPRLRPMRTPSAANWAGTRGATRGRLSAGKAARVPGGRLYPVSRTSACHWGSWRARYCGPGLRVAQA